MIVEIISSKVTISPTFICLVGAFYNVILKPLISALVFEEVFLFSKMKWENDLGITIAIPVGPSRLFIIYPSPNLPI